MSIPTIFTYTRTLIDESFRRSWVAANGLFGALLAGAAMIWRGVLPLVSTDVSHSVLNWVLSFAIYAIGSWAVLFIGSFVFIAPYRSWQKVTLIADAEKQRADALDNRKGARVELAQFHHGGQILMNRCLDKDAQPPNDAANIWAKNVEEFLTKNLDESYITRFHDGSNIMSVIPTAGPFSQDSLNLWSGLRIRVIRMNEFIKELST
jgi:hypothetical protein